jgi:hypothetical protein
MRDDGLNRPLWVARQFLRPQDFVAAQHYHLINRWRHNIGLHRWGIADGLEFDTETPAVLPGLAIDGFGRELVLTENRPIAKNEFDRKGTDSLHVWIVYDRDETEPASGDDGCRGAHEPSSFWYERPFILLTDGTDDIDPRKPEDRDQAGDVEFPPYRPFPIDGAPWPVYLGTMTRLGTATAPKFEVEKSRRPYVGLVGRSIEHPTGLARIDLGSELNPNVHFAVSTLDLDTCEEVPRIALFGPAPTTGGTVEETRLELYEDVVVEGDVTIEQGSLWFRDSRPCGSFSRPWQIYRCVQQSNGKTENVLRFEFGSGFDDRFEIGRWNGEKNTFEPCLAIDRECRVTIGGDLIVDGRAIIAEGIENAAFSPDAVSALDTAQSTSMFDFLQGLASGGAIEFAKQLAQLNATIALRVVAELVGELVRNAVEFNAATEFASRLVGAGKQFARDVMLEIVSPLVSDLGEPFPVGELATRLVQGDLARAREVMLETLHQLAPEEPTAVPAFVAELIKIDSELARHVMSALVTLNRALALEVMLETLGVLAENPGVAKIVEQLVAVNSDLAGELALETLIQLPDDFNVVDFSRELVSRDRDFAVKLRDALVIELA